MKVVVVEQGVRTELEFDGPVVTVGRSIENDIRIAGTRVSRRHCRIEQGPEGVWVHDLGSSNGTRVNGDAVTRRVLSPRDRLEIGAATLTVEGPGDDAGQTRGFDGEVGMQTLTGEAQRERENLRVFARITRELLRETELARLLRLVVDSAVSLAGAERGFVLLREDDPEDPEHLERAGGESPGIAAMKVRIARSFDHEDIPVPAESSVRLQPNSSPIGPMKALIAEIMIEKE